MNTRKNLATRIATMTRNETMPAVTSGPAHTRYPKQIRLPLSEAQFEALQVAKAQSGIDGVTILRTLLELYGRDERLRQRVDARARELR